MSITTTSSSFLRGAAGRRSLAALATVGVLLLGACASSTRLEPAAPVEDRSLAGGAGAGAGGAGGANASGVGGSGAAANALGGSRVATIDLGRADDGAGGANGLPKVVYFDFDSFVVADTYRNVIEANARFLNSDRRRRVIIEGHTDERGGREYNLALGQKRADAVARALTLLGVQEAQAEAVSYGEERPAVSGSDEAAMAKNRRAELKAR